MMGSPIVSLPIYYDVFLNFYLNFSILSKFNINVDLKSINKKKLKIEYVCLDAVWNEKVE